MSRAHRSGFAALVHDYRHYAGARLWATLAVMLLGALAEGFGLLMIVPLTSIAIGRGESTIFRFAPWASKIPPDERFMIALLLFLGAMIARGVLLFARDLQIPRLSAGYEASLRLRAAASLAARGWRFASGVGQGGMQSLLLNDVPRAGEAVAHMQQIAVSAIMLMVQLALTALLAPVLTAVAVVFLIAGALASIGWTRRGVRSGLAIVETMEESAGSGFRLHAGLKAALAQGTVGAFLEEYRVTLANTAAQVTRFARDHSAARQLASVSAAIAAALLLFVGVRLLALPLPVLITSLILFARMSLPAQSIQQSAQQVAAYAPAFAAVERRVGKLELPGATMHSPQPLPWRSFELRDMEYMHGEDLGLQRAALTLSAGEWIGIAGPSGSGKTTLVDIVAGLLPAPDGKLLVDGAPLTDGLLERWRASLAYVGQDGAVFNDSIRGNLLAEGATADDAALWAVLADVGMDGRVRALAKGLDESIGDRGSQLSGGERQRLVIARALLRRPSLLILDEATAALDPESEEALLLRLRALDPRPAALVVAHRQSGLAHCDSVLSIRHGVVERARV